MARGLFLFKGDFKLIGSKCLYEIAPEDRFGKMSFDKAYFGGTPRGAVEIYRERLVFYKKNNSTLKLLGIIGALMEGKGERDLIISRHMIVESERNEDVFTFATKDGRKGYVKLYGFSKKEAGDALEAFLRPQQKL